MFKMILQKLLTNNHRIRVINLKKHTKQVALANSAKTRGKNHVLRLMSYFANYVSICIRMMLCLDYTISLKLPVCCRKTTTKIMNNDRRTKTAKKTLLILLSMLVLSISVTMWHHWNWLNYFQVHACSVASLKRNLICVK